MLSPGRQPQISGRRWRLETSRPVLTSYVKEIFIILNFMTCQEFVSDLSFLIVTDCVFFETFYFSGADLQEFLTINFYNILMLFAINNFYSIMYVKDETAITI